MRAIGLIIFWCFQFFRWVIVQHQWHALIVIGVVVAITITVMVLIKRRPEEEIGLPDAQHDKLPSDNYGKPVL